MVKVNQVMALNQMLKSFSGNLHVDKILRNETKVILFKQFCSIILLLPSTRKVMIMLFGLESLSRLYIFLKKFLCLMALLYQWLVGTERNRLTERTKWTKTMWTKDSVLC